MRKKTFIPALALLLILCVGCRGSAGDLSRNEVSGSLEEIMQSVYDGAGLELPMMGNTVITEENMAYFLGASDIPMTEGLASEAMISAIAHSVCLLRVPADADVSAVENKILDNVNPNKWICVGVDEQNVIVDSIGDLVILIMADGAEKLHESFLALGK